MTRMLGAAVAVLLGSAGLALGQGGADFVVCPTQQEIEQYLGSRGELVPESCRTISVTTLESAGRQLCVADISEDGSSILGAIADAAVPTQWWAACDDASALLR